MQLTRQADYAIRALLHLSVVEPGEVVQTKEIAASQDIPEKYLPTIMRTLARAGLVRTLRGNQGGVMLSRDPADIDLLEAIEAIEEPILLNRCLRAKGECGRDELCPVYPVWAEIQESVISRLKSTSFADLAADGGFSAEPSRGWQLSKARGKVPA